MDRTETIAILKILKLTYPTYYRDYTKEEASDLISVWQMMFANESSKIVSEAVKATIETCKFPPTIAEIKEKINIMRSGFKIDHSGIEEWNKIMKAIADSNYNAGKYFDDFDDMTKKLVGSPNQLREWGMMHLTSLEVAKSHFLKSFKNLIQKEIEYDKLPSSAKKLSQELNCNGQFKLEDTKVATRSEG